jgi:adenosylcobinamide-GDP ribazoletransferase
MKTLLNSVLAAFTMFSKIPVRRRSLNWETDGMRFMMAAFPLVGVVIGALVFGWLRLCAHLELAPSLRALGLTLLPLAVTGGIHLDGLCDTCDALGAKVTPERRREILKDPRAGAFGVIGVAVYLVAYYALAAALPEGYEWPLALSYPLGRALSGLAVTTFPGVGDGTASYFKSASSRLSVLILLLIAAASVAAAALLSEPLRLPLWVAAALVCLLNLKLTARRKFGGMSGDLAGWFLQRCELWQLAALVLAAVLEKVL